MASKSLFKIRRAPRPVCLYWLQPASRAGRYAECNTPVLRHILCMLFILYDFIFINPSPLVEYHFRKSICSIPRKSLLRCIMSAWPRLHYLLEFGYFLSPGNVTRSRAADWRRNARCKNTRGTRHEAHRPNQSTFNGWFLSPHQESLYIFDLCLMLQIQICGGVNKHLRCGFGKSVIK